MILFSLVKANSISTFNNNKSILMKKIFTLAFSILISSQIFAAAEFFVKLNSNGNYTVSLNGQTMISSTNVFRFFDLYAGNYNLKVIENGVFGRVIYDQPVQIQDGFRTVAELNNYSNLNIIAKLPFVQSSWYIDNLQTNQPPYGNNNPSCPKPPKQNHGHWNNGYGNGNNGYGNNNYPNNYPNYPGSYPNNYPNNYPTGSGGNYGYGNSNLMDDASLQTLIQTMKNAAFEDKMIGIAKTALKTSQLKTNQVHQLLGLFSFEQNKLELAKFCYDKTIDKNNYYTLYNDFTFSNYSTQLDKYINSK